MSPGPADQVNAQELASRAALVERTFGLDQLPRVQDAGGLPGTRVAAGLRFGTDEGRTTIDVHVTGVAVVPCQRCLRACECALDDSSRVVVVRDDAEEVPGGCEPFVAVPEHLSLAALVEEQVLLALPLVPMHEAGEGGCSAADVVPLAPGHGSREGAAAEPVADDKQTPFANLRELLERKNERGPASGE
jgi:uncharacterized protein